MKIKLVNETEITVTSASGMVCGGLTDQAAFVSLLAELTDENVNQIDVYDGDNLIGRYANLRFLSATITQTEDIDGNALLVATITTKGQDATLTRVAALEGAVDQLVMDALTTSIEEV